MEQEHTREDKTPRNSKEFKKCNCTIVYSLSEVIDSRPNSNTDEDELDYGTNNINQPRTKIIYPAPGKKVMPPWKTMQKKEWKFRVDDRDFSLLEPILSWDEKVLKVLHMIRFRELTEFNAKLGFPIHTRFCRFNIALFDLDRESKVKPGPRFNKIPESDYWKLDNSINVISIRVAESDVPFPINVYGTVLARDENDYRCVYLFKRGRMILNSSPRWMMH